jgi:two-component system, LytTR family, response regulator
MYAAANGERGAMKLRALVADDEPLARRRLVRLLEGRPGVEVVGECADGPSAVAAIRRERPDLVFLDVQMSGMDGFAVLREAGPGPLPLVVFVTAHDRYALRAFEVHAVDYLLKPLDPARLDAALERAAARAARGRRTHERRLVELLEELGREQRDLGRRLAPPADGARTPERLLLKLGERMVFVPVEAIERVEAEGNYVRIHAGKERYLVRGTLAGMEKLLDPRRFLRIHRSTVVNLDRVREVRPAFAGDCTVVLHDGTELRLSRRYRDRLERIVESA